jgi:uncharacterized membrane protein YeaQ/YmgE (transglycosylase-associated protein family)
LINALQEGIMSLLAWVFLGFIAGFIASKVLLRTRQGVVLDIAVGILGAVIGASLLTTFGIDGAFVAVVGAALLLAAYCHLVSLGRSLGLG